jgi:hypothetical protein
MNRANLYILVLFLTITTALTAQTSPLAKGKWAKMAVQKQGIFKLTGAQIRSMGFSLPIASAQIQLFSLDPSLLLEKVPNGPIVGLSENALKVNDGGDGQIDETDFILFYGEGPIKWNHNEQQNISNHFSRSAVDSVFYYMTIGSNGKRVGIQNTQSNIFENRSEFTQRFLFEKDSISFLNSGKTLWGLPMGVGVGKQSQINFLLSTQGMNSASSIKCVTHLASTSYQLNGQFDFYWNDQLAHTTLLQPVTGMLFDDIAKEVTDSFDKTNYANWPSKSNLKVSYTSANATATGWIDFIEIVMQKPIGFWQDSTLYFSIENNIQKGKVVNCNLQNIDANSMIWNVTNSENPIQISWQSGLGNTGSFLQKTDSAQAFFAVKNNAFESPILLGSVPNQDLFNVTGEINYVIVAAPAYLQAAKKYQQFQQNQFGRQTMVINARELYNDFSGGQPSHIAIRNFLKHLHNKANQNKGNAPEYLLLMGMGNFNPQKMNLDFELPVYESDNSTSILSSFSTDDFFTILTPGDDIKNYNAIQQLSMSAGRIPARTFAEADSAIEKLIRYQSAKVGGEWENKITWIADDGDYNLHLQDAEAIVANLQTKTTKWNQEKLYLDLFPALASTSGNTYPLVNNNLQQSVYDGILLINYTGHGNYLRLAEEGVITQSQLELWNNRDKLPLLVTASCNFAPYDQPNINAIAWDAFMKNGKGIIGLVAANRLVFAYSNKQINDLFIQQVLVDDSLGNGLSIGRALQKAKNVNWKLGGDRVNDFKFNVIGDPALVLNRPSRTIEVESMNGLPFKNKDTLFTGSSFQLKGWVKQKGVKQTDFNGVFTLTIYDAVKYKNTLANQSSSMVVPIADQSQVLFKGNSTIKNGVIQAGFILPLQVSNSTQPIRMQLTASSGIHTAIQIFDAIYVKSNTLNIQKDTIGPEIIPYLNEPQFKQGDWSSKNPTLYIRLKDSAGIQSSGNALGRDLSIWIDQNPTPIIFNNYFITDLDTYQSGTATVSLPEFTVGKHFIIIKAWDLLGNGTKDTIYFEVPPTNGLLYKKPFNFPNPVQSYSRFGFETNQTGKTLTIHFEILNQSGQLVYSRRTAIENMATKIYVDWDGKTNEGQVLTPGVYYYRFTIQNNKDISILSNSFLKL